VACIASLIETCKLHGVDPQTYGTYVTDVLTKVVNLWSASYRVPEILTLGRFPDARESDST